MGAFVLWRVIVASDGGEGGIMIRNDQSLFSDSLSRFREADARRSEYSKSSTSRVGSMSIYLGRRAL